MNKAYTLIEILMAVSIFMIMIAAPTGFFVGSLKAQQKALASQKLLDNTSYVLEYMGRAIRMAKKELNCSSSEPSSCFCLKTKGYGYNYENPGGFNSEIRFVNYQESPVCQKFFLDKSDNRLKERRNGADPVALTSDDLEVISFKIGPSDSWDQNDTDQPRVTIFLEIKGGKNLKDELQPKIKIQTTISQRNLDVPY